jgi:hypothetical protein
MIDFTCRKARESNTHHYLPPNDHEFRLGLYIVLSGWLYMLHSACREQEIVDTIQVLVAEKADLDLSRTFAT